MSISFFESYKFLVIPLWLYCWNPYKIRVRLQKVISTTCITIQLTFFIYYMIDSFFQHYDTDEDAILVTFFGINITICFLKHCSLLFRRKSFESVIDFFNNHLAPEEEECQKELKKNSKPVVKFVYPFLGMYIIFSVWIILVPIIQKYFSGEQDIIVPMFKVDIVTRSFTIGVMCLSSAIYNCLFISFCNFINAHIDVLIYQIFHIEYERGCDTSELRKSLNRVMQKHASILTANELRCKVFFWLVFLQQSVSTACICFALVHSKDTSTLICLPCQIIEICIFCHFGQTVENKSEEIAFAYYSTPWPEMDPTDRKLILVALHNSQKTLKTSGGPFQDLSHETLKNILQSAYSFYAVLKEIK